MNPAVKRALLVAAGLVAGWAGWSAWAAWIDLHRDLQAIDARLDRLEAPEPGEVWQRWARDPFWWSR